MKPGPKVPGRLAKTGEYCPPGSEGAAVYRGIRHFRRVCKYGGHAKFHPGRCTICRRASDKKRIATAADVARKRRNWNNWNAKEENKAKRSEYARKYCQRPEVKKANARRQSLYRRGLTVNPKANRAPEIAARLLAKATKAAQGARYGIEGRLTLGHG